MMDGIIQGAWEYVVAAYVIVWVGFAVYALSLYLRHKRLVEREKNFS